ncbi:MAG: hypothetical protein Q7R49_01970 [Candidatus Daviesbacteria bacterium]|nr:hypothetical protein [Candidatus Daviesbacteria bacterium]
MAAELVAASVDFDGVLFPRFPAQMAILKWAFNPIGYRKPFKAGPDLTEEQKAMNYERLTQGEFDDFKGHQARMVKPGTREFLLSLGTDAIFGNTGRKNNLYWVRMTERNLKTGGVDDLFKEIYFKPQGVSSDEGKYWNIRAIKDRGFKVRHFDDNAYLIEQLAPEFPDDEFVLVEDYSSWLLYHPWLRRPNVSSIRLP